MMLKEDHATNVVMVETLKEEGPDDDGDVVVGVAVVPDLPISIISDILSRLPVDDVVRCKCVCKGWENLSKDSHFTHLHFSRSSQEMFHQQRNNILLCFGEGSLLLISNNREENGLWKTGNLLHNIRGLLVASCNGFLCLETHRFDSEGPDILYNPVTKDRILLPEMNFPPVTKDPILLPEFPPYYQEPHSYKCALGLDPSTKKYTMALVYESRNFLDGNSGSFTVKKTCAILKLGESSWRTLQFPYDLENHVYESEPLFFSGAFHWVIGKRHYMQFGGKDETRMDGIIKLDISTDKFEFIEFSDSLVLPALFVQQIQLENSVALVRFNNFNPTGNHSLEIWQILGVNTDGSCLYQHQIFTVAIPLVCDGSGLTLLGALSKGLFLFETRRMKPYGKRLLLYNSEKDEGSVIEIAETPKYFNASIFTPSLISPAL